MEALFIRANRARPFDRARAYNRKSESRQPERVPVHLPKAGVGELIFMISPCPFPPVKLTSYSEESTPRFLGNIPVGGGNDQTAKPEESKEPMRSLVTPAAAPYPV